MSTNTSSRGGLPPLTPSQFAVVRSTSERLLVGAGAGSGKTSTIVQAICHRVGAAVMDENGQSFSPEVTVSLRQLAAITFTNQAAADLKRKLRAALGSAGLTEAAREVDSARVGTIHSFCVDVLREFALQAGSRPTVMVMDDSQSAAIGKAAAERALLNAVESRGAEWLEPLRRGRKLKDLAPMISELATDSARLDAYAANSAELRLHEERLLQLATECAALRRVELAAQGAHDFDSLLLATRDLLRDHEEVRRTLQHRIRLLIVDEFQDVDPVQRDIVMLIAGIGTDDPSPSELMIVGDPKQSIFRFRRADVTLWNAVATRFDTEGVGGTSVELTDNFRSRKGILAFVDHVFGAALDRPVSPLTGRAAFEVNYRALKAVGSDAEGDECVELRCVPAGTDGKARGADEVRRLEAADVAERIEALCKGTYKYGDIAILLSGWGAVEEYESALQGRGIQVY